MISPEAKPFMVWADVLVRRTYIVEALTSELAIKKVGTGNVPHIEQEDATDLIVTAAERLED